MEIDSNTIKYIIRCTDKIGRDWDDFLTPMLLKQSGVEPKDTALWDALMVEYLLIGHTNPWDSFMVKFKGLQVNEEGIITNREEYFGNLKA